MITTKIHFEKNLPDKKFIKFCIMVKKNKTFLDCSSKEKWIEMKFETYLLYREWMERTNFIIQKIEIYEK